MRLAVDEIRQRLCAQRPGRKIGHAPLGIGNAARPAAPVAGASLGKAPARVARGRPKRDQDQAIDVPRYRVWKAGDNRTAKADQQWFPSCGTLRTTSGLSIHYVFMVRSVSRGPMGSSKPQASRKS